MHCEVHKETMCKKVDMEYVYQNSIQCLAGVTVGFLLMAVGAPANDTTTKSQISTAQVALDVINTRTYRYQCVEDTTDTIRNAQTALPQGFTVNQNTINLASGSVQTGVVLA